MYTCIELIAQAIEAWSTSLPNEAILSRIKQHITPKDAEDRQAFDNISIRDTHDWSV